MGQRLNLEIKYNEECIANAYYHWSGYSYTTLALMVKACKAFKNVTSKEEATVLAVKMLEETGAKLGIDEIPVYKNLCPADSFNHEAAEDRNDGIISVSEEGMWETRMWADAESSIDLETDKCWINFQCFGVDKCSYYNELVDGDQTSPFAEDLPVLPFEPYCLMTIEEADKILADVDLEIDYLSPDHSEVIEMLR